MAKKYLYLTPYQFSSNQPIHTFELEGKESNKELGSQQKNVRNQAIQSQLMTEEDPILNSQMGKLTKMGKLTPKL